MRNKQKDYKIPKLAGLCSMDRAVHADWSVEESVSRWKRLHYVAKRTYQIFVSRIASEPIYELKMAFSHHAYLCGEQVSLIRSRVGEMREPPLGLDTVPDAGLAQLMDEVQCSTTIIELLLGIYEVVTPAILSACEQMKTDAHPLADAPSVRAAKLIAFELAEVKQFGDAAIEQLVSDEDRGAAAAWIQELQECISHAGGLDGTLEPKGDLPGRRNSKKPFQYDREPKRDGRFQDPFNAGVNPEAFLYDERFSPQDKTLMMYYKRIRELDVPEMMASILFEIGETEPWEFHMEMVRQLWDEARHAMMGEVGFESQNIDWTKIPINFTWSRNLNLQLDPRERHGVLFFIEQGLMTRTGKRYEWEVATESGDPLSALFQDFDWADEVLHAQIGRRWYVPKFDSLSEAMDYGDKCWSKVLSQWKEYRDTGLTDHRNWWPEIYQQACRQWQKEPDADALAFCETYEDSRADLNKIE